MFYLELILGFAAGVFITLLVAKRRLSETRHELILVRETASSTQREVLRKEKLLIQDQQKKFSYYADQMRRIIESRYAITYEHTRIRFEIIDYDGTSVMTRTHRGLNTGSGLSLRSMEHHVACGTPGSKIVSLDLGGENSSASVQLEMINRSDTEVKFNVLFPDRPKGGVNYEYRAKTEKAVLMTKEEVELAYASDPSPYEGMFHDNDVPSRVIDLEVVFPKGYRPKCRAQVYLGHSWERQADISASLEIRETQTSALLHIEHPFQGFRYLIEWISPTAEEVAKLREGVLSKSTNP